MPIAAAQAIVDLLCVIHIYKTGRPYYWYLIVVGFPLLGALAYLLFEVIPSTDGRRLAKRVIRKIDLSADLKERILEAERCGSVANRTALAEELVNTGQFDPAINLYQSCLTGLHQDDPAILFGLATAYYHKGDAAQAVTWLDRVIAIEPWFRSGDAKLIRAQALARAGRSHDALAQFEAIAEHYPGEEARCRYAVLLAESGQPEAADHIMQEVDKRCRLNGRPYVRTNEESIGTAKRRLKDLRQQAAAPRSTR
jgi:hypothetical protein